MPTYNYICHSCDHSFEDFRKISNRHWDLPCPSCGAEKENVELVLTGAPKIVSGVGSVHSKTSHAFRDKLNALKKHYPQNNIRV